VTGLAGRLAGHLLRGLVMVYVVTTFTFFLVRLMPGDPVTVQYERLLEHGMSPEQAEAQTAVTYGFLPHGPLWRQYLDHLWRLAHLDLGTSVTAQGVPVANQLAAAAPWTVTLVLTGIMLSFLVGVTLGVLAAVRRSTTVGHALSVSGSLVHGVPAFALGVVLLALLTRVWRVFPDGRPYDADYLPGWHPTFVGNVAYHATLPALTYTLAGYGGWLLAMKSSVVSLLGEDFVLAADLRGLTPFTRLRYLARNAILPLFTVLAISFGHLFGGAVLIERIFNYNGLGALLYDGIRGRDGPVMSGAFLLITISVTVANILADLLYTVIDPRVRITRRGAG
jgi:peptide/nickel transport system permease protein